MINRIVGSSCSYLAFMSDSIQAFFYTQEQSHFNRKWSSEDVLRLRNVSLVDSYALSNVQAQKLRASLHKHTQNKTTDFTFGEYSGAQCDVLTKKEPLMRSWPTRWAKRVSLACTALELMRL
jgi:isocitrate lyase